MSSCPPLTAYPAIKAFMWAKKAAGFRIAFFDMSFSMILISLYSSCISITISSNIYFSYSSAILNLLLVSNLSARVLHIAFIRSSMRSHSLCSNKGKLFFFYSSLISFLITVIFSVFASIFLDSSWNFSVSIALDLSTSGLVPRFWM